MNIWCKRIELRHVTIVAACVALLSSVAARAEDGIVLINQATVMVGAGFPFRITNPGSYKLSSNLVVLPHIFVLPGTVSLDAIEVSSDNVTIDLNGFSITGGVSAISDAGVVHKAITVRNGVISGSLGSAINLGDCLGCTIEQLRLHDGQSNGIVVGPGALVMDNVVTGFSPSSPAIGISTGSASTVTANTVAGNHARNPDPVREFIGVEIGALSTLTANTVSDNDRGIEIHCPSNFVGNTAFHNQNSLGNADVTMLGVEQCTSFDNSSNVTLP